MCSPTTAIKTVGFFMGRLGKIKKLRKCSDLPIRRRNKQLMDSLKQIERRLSILI